MCHMTTTNVHDLCNDWSQSPLKFYFLENFMLLPFRKLQEYVSMWQAKTIDQDSIIVPIPHET